MDTTMSIYASLKQKQGTEILKINPLSKPCFEASYEFMFQRTKEPETLY